MSQKLHAVRHWIAVRLEYRRLTADLRHRAYRIYAEQAFNAVVTHIPNHALRLWALRRLGVRLGEQCVLFRGTTVLGAEKIVLGDRVNVGFRCLLDGRGGLTIADDVVIASDVHLITGEHDIHSPTFAPLMEPITLDQYVWLGSRATVLMGVRMGYGSVAAACALVTADVPDLAVVGGVPAKPIAERTPDLDYQNTLHPRFY